MLVRRSDPAARGAVYHHTRGLLLPGVLHRHGQSAEDGRHGGAPGGQDLEEGDTAVRGPGQWSGGGCVLDEQSAGSRPGDCLTTAECH